MSLRIRATGCPRSRRDSRHSASGRVKRSAAPHQSCPWNLAKLAFFSRTVMEGLCESKLTSLQEPLNGLIAHVVIIFDVFVWNQRTIVPFSGAISEELRCKQQRSPIA